MGKKGDISKCLLCDKKFIMNAHTHKFCSADCRVAYNLKNNENLTDLKTSRYYIFERDDFKCVYCGGSPIEDGIKLTLDHVVPYHINMDNNVYNLVTCCRECNMRKNTNILKKEVYERIISRNKEKNKNIISPESAEFINKVLTKYYSDTKKNY